MTYLEIRDKIGRPVRLTYNQKGFGKMSRTGIVIAGSANKIIFSFLDDDEEEHEIVIRNSQVEDVKVLNSKKLLK